MSDIPDKVDPISLFTVDELINELERRSESCLVAFTAHGDSPHSSGMAMMAAYKTRPFELQGLCDRLDTLIREHVDEYIERMYGTKSEDEDEDNEGWKKGKKP